MRKPDLIIGDNYLHRWYIIPRNKFINIYLHKFMADDDDRALHDHPWWSVSFLLKGRLIEWQPYRGLYRGHYWRSIPRWLPVFRSAKFAHRLELAEGPAWTVFITGPRVREWGFHCPQGWKHWSKFTDPTGTKIGRGCE